jgi:hypothetical protein
MPYVKKYMNTVRKLSPELMVIKGVDSDHPEEKETIDCADVGVSHRSMQILGGPSRVRYLALAHHLGVLP